jgi:hypothetical protein
MPQYSDDIADQGDRGSGYGSQDIIWLSFHENLTARRDKERD